MKSDVEISRQSKMKPILEICESLNIEKSKVEQYGSYKAKLDLSLIDTKKRQRSKLILVSAISPTPAGEGKTTTSIGLCDGLNAIGLKAGVVLREPSLGPVFGMKGGGAGGGYAQVMPMEDINLHFTGDFSAIEKAHNLLCALIDNSIHFKNHALSIDHRSVTLKRVMDMNDRSLRKIVTGLGGPSFGMPRESGFDITAASEVMAILCLAKDREDLVNRMGNIYIGQTFDHKPVFARDLNAEGAMAALLKDAIKPNLAQTLENNPAIIHGGPFANIAQGTNSVMATYMGQSLFDLVITEAGFGFDLGGEKFLDIKCQSAGLSPQLVVLVASVRALKYHGGLTLSKITTVDFDCLNKGLENLDKHLENVATFGLQAIVSINRFPTDSDLELKIVMDHCQNKGVKSCINDSWAHGSDGSKDLAHAVSEILAEPSSEFTPLYSWKDSIENKIETIAKKIYGANCVEYTSKAKTGLALIDALQLNELPICMAKTEKSLSDNPKLLGRPRDFTVTVSEIEIASGASFIIPITGTMMRMPGLPSMPRASQVTISKSGEIEGLF